MRQVMIVRLILISTTDRPHVIRIGWFPQTVVLPCVKGRPKSGQDRYSPRPVYFVDYGSYQAYFQYDESLESHNL